MSLNDVSAGKHDPPPDLHVLAERLAAAGISVTLPIAGPEDELPEPLVIRTSLSTAIIEERDDP